MRRARGDKESSGDGSDIWLSPGIIVCAYQTLPMRDVTYARPNN